MVYEIKSTKNLQINELKSERTDEGSWKVSLCSSSSQVPIQIYITKYPAAIIELASSLVGFENREQFPIRHVANKVKLNFLSRSTCQNNASAM